MTTTKCRCGAEFTKETQHAADQALRMHIMRKHRRPRMMPRQSRRPSIKWNTPMAEEPSIKYCPCCGQNLMLMQQAMRVAARVARG